MLCYITAILQYHSTWITYKPLNHLSNES